MEPNTSTSVTPQSPRSRRKLLSIAIVVFVVLIVIPVAVFIIWDTRGNKPKTADNGSSLKDVALAANAKVNLTKLPDGKTLFFTTMQRTASETLVGGEYGEGYHSPSQNNDIITNIYREDNISWKQGKVAFDYAELPWDPAPVVGFSLERCLHGQASIYTSYVPAPSWKPEDSAASATTCNVSSGIDDGKTNIDDILAAGMNKDQATVWVDLLAVSEDSQTRQPLFEFGTPAVTTLDGKQVIAVTFHINKIHDSAYCDFACGMTTLPTALKKANVDVQSIGYSPQEADYTAQGTYYIDPTTLLPVRSVVSTFDAAGRPDEEFRRQFRFTSLDLSNTSTAQPATTPELISGFTELKDNSLPPPGQ